MSRKNAREIALHLIFEMGFGVFESDEILTDRLDEEILSSISGEIALYAGKLSDKQVEYIMQVVKGVAGELGTLDGQIAQFSTGWTIERMSRMTTAILRLALYEMQHVEDVPVAAAINEAVELAKTYDAPDAPPFVNGVLGSAARALHLSE